MCEYCPALDRARGRENFAREIVAIIEAQPESEDEPGYWYGIVDAILGVCEKELK